MTEKQSEIPDDAVDYINDGDEEYVTEDVFITMPLLGL